MRAKFDIKAGKTRAVFSDADRKALGKAIEVLTNLQVCEQVDMDLTEMAIETARELGTVSKAYPAEPAKGNP